ncbi:sugar ABC transporter ATP-binding protein [Sphingobacterium sp. C459-1T]|uniref:Sugar ABC transporter ATP-binding protein n=2 Tax=Sphingobacterium faecale TaxID=2803775 RepID=A0ABS1R657_9SPHI|nr:sugar ABC transporter ATP-binding protein [Sphingobacterium faecale]
MLYLQDITKSFGGVKALKGVNLEIAGGEIHALLGENGAGKSTLMKIISGAHQSDTGSLIFRGKEISNNNPHLAKGLGISIIYQEFSLVPELSVSENIYLGRPGSWIDWKQLDKDAEALIHSLGFEIDVKKKVSQLPVAQQQVVEIAKALAQQVNLLILDEPSAVLGTAEIKKLFSLLQKLKEKGVGIIYISHHLEELLELSDRITVLKDGKTVQTVKTSEVCKDKLVQLMVGREMSQLYPQKINTIKSDEYLQVSNLKSSFSKEVLSFSIRKGEILGVGGLVGSGRTELLESLFGLLGAKAGMINFETGTLQLHSPRKLVAQGLGMVPEDRKRYGGLLELSIRENVSLANMGKISNKYGFLDLKKERAVVSDLIKKLQIKLGDMDDQLATLSGGNQQKVILAKWLNLDLKVLLIDEPTRGVDVGARFEIYQIIQELADQGIYILMVSSDMEELIGLSDRILVLKNGHLQGIIDRRDFSEESILRMAIGAN